MRHKTIVSFIIILWKSAFMAFCQSTDYYFPTGMTWKEVAAEPNYLPLDTIRSTVYEIGTDTIINERVYKQVYREGKNMNIWIREESGHIWLLSEVYPHDIMLYNFNWSPDTLLYTEYITETDNGPELCKEKFSVNDAQTITCGLYSYQYIWNWENTTIRGIGKVADLNMNSCLLGYRRPQAIVPGETYNKVLWIIRNNKEIFRSEVAEEWTTKVPTTTDQITTKLNDECSTSILFDLQGRPQPKPQGKGIYIRRLGRKVVR